MTEVSYAPEAQDEAEAAIRHYAEQRPGLEDRFLLALKATEQRMIEAPKTGIPQRGVAARKMRFERFPYALVYIEQVDGLRVIAVAHDKRRPRFWRGRR